MTGRDLADAMALAKRIELAARQASDRDPAERVLALDVVRHAVALRRGLEQWVVSRAMGAEGE